MKKYKRIEKEKYPNWFKSMSIAEQSLNIFEGHIRVKNKKYKKQIDGWLWFSYSSMIFTNAYLSQFIALLTQKGHIKSKDFTDKVKEASLKFRNIELTEEEIKNIETLYSFRNYHLHNPGNEEEEKYIIFDPSDEQKKYSYIESKSDKQAKQCRKYFDWVYNFTHDIEIYLTEKGIEKETLHPSFFGTGEIIDIP